MKNEKWNTLGHKREADNHMALSVSCIFYFFIIAFPLIFLFFLGHGQK